MAMLHGDGNGFGEAPVEHRKALTEPPTSSPLQREFQHFWFQLCIGMETYFEICHETGLFFPPTPPLPHY